MDIIARECDFVTGRTVEHGGAGDSSVLTAFGVYQGMRASAQHLWGDTSLAGKRVGVAGVGKVGKHLVGHLIEEDAQVVVTDVNAEAVAALKQTYPSITSVVDTDALVREPLDIYAPCALGGALDDEVVEVLTGDDRLRCGQQPARPRGHREAPRRARHHVRARLLRQLRRRHPGRRRARGLRVRSRQDARRTTIYDTTLGVLERAKSEGVPPSIAADRMAEQRMREVGRLRSVWLAL